MKKHLLLLFCLMLGVSVMAQQKIQLRSADKAECVKSDMTSLKASFSFSTIEAQDVQSERGTFSWLNMPNTVIGGNEGDPQIPVINEVIAVPFGANPRIVITSYSTTDYRLEDLGINTLVPRQPSLRKDQKPEEVPFVYNEQAYQKRGLRSEPMAVVSVEGTMRGVQVGKMTIEPVSYDPVSNTLRVFNNIEAEVYFDDADIRATEEMLVKTYSPYFDVVYAQLFNGRSVKDAYSEHPDLYTTPVKMIVITTATYAANAKFQRWVNWKKQKGIYTTVYTTATTGTTSSSIKSFIRNKYSIEAPTFVVIVGDTGDVTYSLSSSTTSKVTDLYYSTTEDSDLWPEMFLSRMPVSSTSELENLLNKIMTYEQYSMADPSYLSKVLLIAGSDGTWNPRVGQPTINYAADNYFNTAHGFTNVYKYLSSYTNCYDNMNTGIGFANYTAHGGETGWSGPSFSVSDANSLTNDDKYFWAMGNCCLAANWGYSGVCLAEALLRSQNKGAFGYIGSCPETYWWEDYYFGVGATSVTNSTPAMSQTQTGTYDAMFMDDMYNTLNSVPFLGNIAVAYAHANSYQSSVSDQYYWEAYHTLGDGSVMPYHVNPSANNVSHAATIGIGMTTFNVMADAGSYVAISKDNEILGVAQVGSTGSVDVTIDPVTTSGDVMVVVTRQQRQPYIATIPAVAMEGPYLSVNSYTPTTAHVGDNTTLSLTFKNVGAEATTGTTTVTLTPGDSNANVTVGTKTFGALAVDATTTVSGFKFTIKDGVADGTNVPLHYKAVNGSNEWEGDVVITAKEAVLEYQYMSWNGSFSPGETLTLTAKFKNTGHYQATNAVATMSTTSSYLTINTESVNVGTIAVDGEASCQFSVTIAAGCPETAQIPVTFVLNADGDLSARGSETLKNSCNVVFDLADSYGDGWNGASLVVSFDDGTTSQSLTVSSGSSASYTIEIGNGTHVTLTWSSGSYDSECSFTVKYDDNLIIYSQTTTPSSGVLYEFDCNCAAASQTFNVTVTSNNTTYGTVSGGGEYLYGETCTVTATPKDGYSFMNWTQGGEVVSTNATYSFVVNSDVNLVANFIGNLNVTVSANPEEGGIVTVGSKNVKSELVYDFEDGTTQGWTLLKGTNGNSANNWMHITDYTPRDYTSGKGHNSSDGFVISESYISTEEEGQGTAVYPDNYLVSPQIELGGSITFWATNVNDDYGEEHFAVAVSTNSNTDVNDFTQLQAWTLQPSSKGKKTRETRNILNGTWYEYTVDLSAYSGMGYVAIHHFDCYDMWLLCVDDITIMEATTGGDTPNTNGTTGTFSYGANCVVTATPNEGYYFVNWTENGTEVSSNANYSFNVTTDRNLVANFTEGFVIGSGSETSDYLPTYSYYNYSLTQQIYTVEELGTPGVISSIAFFNGGATKTRNCDFYIKATEKSAFSSSTDWESVTADDLVFSGEVTMTANDWTVITFTTPYIYDGASNIVLVTDDNTGSYTYSPHMSCRVFSATSQTLRVYNDNTNYSAVAPSYSGTIMNVKNQLLLTKDAMSGCMRPTHLTATEIGPDFVTLSWTENGEAEQWYVVYNDSYKIANTNVDFVLTGLDPETEYTIAVRPACDENLFSNSIVITTLESCPVPQNLTVGNINGNTAKLTWDGYNDSYNVQLGQSAFLISPDFNNGIPADWDNSSEYPWTVVDGQIMSGNGGVASSTSAISVTVTYPSDGTISFDFWSRGEGTDSNDWDKSRFYIDDEKMFDYGKHESWESYSADIAAGTHTFKWEYKKDSSVNPDGDCFIVGNVVMSSGSIVWNDAESVVNPKYTFRDLEELTTYCVRVQGVCGSTTTAWSETIMFTTTELMPTTQDIGLLTGSNWVSFNVEISLNDLKAALVEAAPGTSIMIKGKDYNALYNPGTDRWTGRLTTLDVNSMYNIKMESECDLVVEGMLLNPDNQQITIKNGTNWIVFPLDESVSITDAFGSFPVNGDVLKSQHGTATYTRGRWMGNTLTTLEPGQGYMYISNTSADRVLIFESNK